MSRRSTWPGDPPDRQHPAALSFAGFPETLRGRGMQRSESGYTFWLAMVRRRLPMATPVWGRLRFIVYLPDRFVALVLVETLAMCRLFRGGGKALQFHWVLWVGIAARVLALDAPWGIFPFPEELIVLVSA